MHLVIVESPAKAKTINKYLGDDFKVIASYGHVRDLPSKNGSVEPDNDFAMHYEVSAQSTKHVKAIADAVKTAESIYLATDPDREGEAISWHIIETLKARRQLKKTIPVYRVAFHEITKKAVLEAIANPRTINMDLVNAQQARRALDYLVGFTLSPILWRKLPGSRSAGRVQSVALRLVCEREKDIESFHSREYWSILLHLLSPKKEPFTARLTHLDGKKLEQFDIVTEEAATKAVTALRNDPYHVTQIEKKQSKRHPQPPFTTSSLQQDASRKLGFSAKQTMMLAQRLYEGVDIQGETVGLITYMRTDSVVVSKDAITQTRALIKQQYGEAYLPDTPRTYQSKAKNAQEAHEAIRPTDMEKIPSQIQTYLDPEQYKLYKLIWERMAASQTQSAILDQVAITIENPTGQYIARANGSTIHFDGFYRIYREGSDDDTTDTDNEDRLLPVLQEKDPVALNEVEPLQHFTQPPPRYTEASLVKNLEELGIGRPSTYASILSVLQDRHYVKLEKKRFIAEDRGRIVTAFLESFFEKYVQYDFTANLEEELDNVANGTTDWKTILKQFWNEFHADISEAEKHTITEVIRELNKLLADYLFPKDKEGHPDRTCPSCADGRLSLKLGKYGAFLGCSNYPDCNYTKQLGEANGEENGEPNNQADPKASVEPQLLGVDPQTGLDIHLKKGPYGFYVQLGEDTKDKKQKPKRASIPKGTDPLTLSLGDALAFLALPREIGLHPETNQMIYANYGPFGPYLQHEGKFTSLKEDSPLTIGINRAVTVIAEEKANGKGRTKKEALRQLGTHPDTKEVIEIFKGKYGPYIKYQKLNVTIPKKQNYETLTLDEALDLIKQKLEKDA